MFLVRFQIQAPLPQFMLLQQLAELAVALAQRPPTPCCGGLAMLLLLHAKP